jgi:hypothetical protein
VWKTVKGGKKTYFSAGIGTKDLPIVSEELYRNTTEYAGRQQESKCAVSFVPSLHLLVLLFINIQQ